jgi:cupin 2 domain-containing protein
MHENQEPCAIHFDLTSIMAFYREMLACVDANARRVGYDNSDSAMTHLMQGNLFRELPDAAGGEVFEDILRGNGFRVERIVSAGQCTPPGEWLVQAKHEWVMVLRGAGSVRFDGEAAARRLGPGDYLFIPANTRHRVEWTDPDQPTIWLAIHYGAAE